MRKIREMMIQTKEMTQIKKRRKSLEKIKRNKCRKGNKEE
jgi:hypothetical protein